MNVSLRRNRYELVYTCAGKDDIVKVRGRDAAKLLALAKTDNEGLQRLGSPGRHIVWDCQNSCEVDGE